MYPIFSLLTTIKSTLNILSVMKFNICFTEKLSAYESENSLLSFKQFERFLKWVKQRPHGCTGC